MGEYERSITVSVAPDTLFDYISDIENLPHYLPRLTSARKLEGDKVVVTAQIAPEGEPEQEVESEAWMRVRTAGQTLEWGSTGPNDYHGELDVDDTDDPNTSKLTVRLTTLREDGPEIEQGLQEALDGVRDTVEQAEASTAAAEI